MWLLEVHYIFTSCAGQYLEKISLVFLIRFPPQGDWRAEVRKLNHAHISPPLAHCRGPIIMMMHPVTLRQLFFYYPKIAWSVASTQSSSCVVLCKNPVQVLFSHLLCTIYFVPLYLLMTTRCPFPTHVAWFGRYNTLMRPRECWSLCFDMWERRAFYTHGHLIAWKMIILMIFRRRGSTPYATI